MISSSAPARWVSILWVVVAMLSGLLGASITAGALWFTLARQTDQSSHTYQQPITALVLNLPSGDVTVLPGPPGQVTIQRQLFWTIDKPAIHENWQGQTLLIDAVAKVFFSKAALLAT